jgi:hypothetical protein
MRTRVASKQAREFVQRVLAKGRRKCCPALAKRKETGCCAVTQGIKGKNWDDTGTPVNPEINEGHGEPVFSMPVTSR